MENQAIYEIIGYIASVLVAVSLMMSAIVKLRIVNLIGAATFSLYGVLIDSIPVAGMNGFIVLINIYYLYRIWNETEYFKFLKVEPQSEYLKEFLRFYSEDINRFQPGFSTRPEQNFALFTLRDMVPAGLLLGQLKNNGQLIAELDYVIPNYRDFKIGDTLLDKNPEELHRLGVKSIYTKPGNSKHNRYLEKMGFSRSEHQDYYHKTIS